MSKRCAQPATHPASGPFTRGATRTALPHFLESVAATRVCDGVGNGSILAQQPSQNDRTTSHSVDRTERRACAGYKGELEHACSSAGIHLGRSRPAIQTDRCMAIAVTAGETAPHSHSESDTGVETARNDVCALSTQEKRGVHPGVRSGLSSTLDRRGWPGIAVTAWRDTHPFPPVEGAEMAAGKTACAGYTVVRKRPEGRAHWADLPRATDGGKCRTAVTGRRDGHPLDTEETHAPGNACQRGRCDRRGETRTSLEPRATGRAVSGHRASKPSTAGVCAGWRCVSWRKAA